MCGGAAFPEVFLVCGIVYWTESVVSIGSVFQFENALRRYEFWFAQKY